MRKYWYLFLALALLAGSITLFVQYFAGADEEKVANLNRLLKEGKNISADYAAEYTEKTIKIGRIKTKMYEVDYSFEIGGKAYKGKTYLKSPPAEHTTSIVYLPSNPSVNSADPMNELKKETDKDASTFTLVLAFGFLAASAFNGWKFNEIKKEEAEEIAA